MGIEPDSAKGQKELRKLSGVTWAAFKRGSHYTGAFPTTSGFFSYQITGNKLMAVVDAMELLGLYGECPENLTPDLAPKIFQERIEWGFGDLPPSLGFEVSNFARVPGRVRT